MQKNISAYDYRIFAAAILISLALHAFWMAAIKIVASAPPSKAVKFSKVSFLGPLFARQAIEVRVSPDERSYLEKRYMEKAGKGHTGKTEALNDFSWIVSPAGHDEDGRSPGLIGMLADEPIFGRKLEPQPDPGDY